MPEFDPKLPYNDLPPLPPPLELIETREILKQCISARVALAELKQAAELIPNSAVLVNALPLLEARASSEIENIVTTTDKLFEFADVAEDKADPATKEALRYRTALYEGTKMVQRRMLTTDMAIQIVSIVKGVELDLRAESGTTLRNRASGEVIYTPPVGQKRLQAMLDNWADFMRTSEIRCEPHTVSLAAARSLAHTSYHVGQIVMIARILAGHRWETLTIPRGQSQQFNKQTWGRRSASRPWEDEA
jgi:Fic family protein